VDDLRPPALSGASLAEAISGHARVLTWARGIDLTLDLAGAPDVPEWAARDLYRIAQEGTANALRHGNPTRLWIRLVRSDADTVLEVEDDGVGFDPETSPLGSGIQGMRERAAVLGSDLEIGPGAFGGTRLRVVVPVQPGTAGVDADLA
jgi:two-component system sensor histidine kinase UhpB